MKLDETHGTMDDITGGCNDKTKDIVNALREMIKKINPDGYEVPRKGDKVISHQLDLQKMKDGYCYIMPTKDGVNVGFYQGTSLKDVAKRLEGTGKSMRHLKIRSMEELTMDIGAYIVEAIAVRKVVPQE